MARGTPSLAALLGLVAIAGYQNRDKIGEFLKGMKSSSPGGTYSSGVEDSVKKVLGEGPIGTTIAGGLSDLIDTFEGAGEGEKAKSWVQTGPNTPVTETDLEKALGPEMIDRLTQQTGLRREELLMRLSRTLPDAVDQMTPDGRIPNAAAG